MFKEEKFQRIYVFIAQTMVCLHFFFKLMYNCNISFPKLKTPPPPRSFLLQMPNVLFYC